MVVTLNCTSVNISSLHSISILYKCIHLEFHVSLLSDGGWAKVRYKLLKPLRSILHFSLMINAELEVKATSVAD